MDVLLHKKLRKAKIKVKENFCNVVADADISKCSRETTASYLGAKIQVQKVESKHYSLNILKLLIGVAFDFSKARKLSQKVENSMALSDFLNGYASVSL